MVVKIIRLFLKILLNRVRHLLHLLCPVSALFRYIVVTDPFKITF